MKQILQQLRKTFPDTLLSLAKCSLPGLSVQLIERVRIAFLFEVIFNLAELLSKLAIQDLVIKDILEMRADSSAVKLQGAIELTVL